MLRNLLDHRVHSTTEVARPAKRQTPTACQAPRTTWVAPFGATPALTRIRADSATWVAACAKVALWLMKEHPGADVTFDPIRYSENLGMEAGMLFGSTLLQMRIVGDSAVDGGGAPKRRQARRAKWDAAKTPDVVPERNEDADPDGLLFGQNVTLTGDFAPYDKGRLWELIADAGATVGKNTTKKTTILVAGPWDSVTSKEKKAREYIEKGQNIEIWDEKQLFKALELTEEPPF